MEFPDMFGPLSPRHIQIQTIKERFSYKVVPKSVDTLFVQHGQEDEHWKNFSLEYAQKFECEVKHLVIMSKSVKQLIDVMRRVKVTFKLELLVQEPITQNEAKEIIEEIERNPILQVIIFSMVEVPKQTITRFKKMKVPNKYLRATDIKLNKSRGFVYYQELFSLYPRLIRLE